MDLQKVALTVEGKEAFIADIDAMIAKVNELNEHLKMANELIRELGGQTKTA